MSETESLVTENLVDLVEFVDKELYYLRFFSVRR